MMVALKKKSKRNVVEMSECGVIGGVLRRHSVVPVLTVHRVRLRSSLPLFLALLASDAASRFEDVALSFRQDYSRRAAVKAPDGMTL